MLRPEVKVSSTQIKMNKLFLLVATVVALLQTRSKSWTNTGFPFPLCSHGNKMDSERGQTPLRCPLD